MVYSPFDRPEFPRHRPADTGKEFEFRSSVDPVNERREDAVKRVKAVFDSELERFADSLYGRKEDG